MNPIFETGMMEREPYCSTPFRDLLFRNYTLTFYFRPTVERWNEWYVMDDFGNLARVHLNGGKHYREANDH